MKNLVKIDKFYFVLGITLVFLSMVFVYAFRGIFTSFIVAYEISSPSEYGNKIDVAKLEQASELLFERNTPKFLDSTIPQTKVTVEATPVPTETPADDKDTNSSIDAVQ
ncbi:hypothetical protein ACFL2C_01185 [Patescibacteria group bacterium]